MKFVLKSKTNLEKSTEIFQRSYLNHLIQYMQCREPKGQQLVPIFKKDDRALYFILIYLLFSSNFK